MDITRESCIALMHRLTSALRDAACFEVPVYIIEGLRRQQSAVAELITHWERRGETDRLATQWTADALWQDALGAIEVRRREEARRNRAGQK